MTFSKRWDPKPGDVVSFRHRGFLFGSKTPKMPALIRVREDLAWDDVLFSWKEQIPIPQGKGNSFLMPSNDLSANHNSKPRHCELHWTIDQVPIGTTLKIDARFFSILQRRWNLIPQWPIIGDIKDTIWQLRG